ncbi:MULTISPECIES: DUF2065 domain-containing protein [Ancylobacter]|uniref:DUF2065 domain-containing protein n=2 Tax=Ancylobacter TaxID=99 RepID=A0A839ZCL4_9HYPH|nr:MULTISPECIES: DUF2065 domain-containing protein [Ancylobacter]MBB3772458.1 hypothetical protein [Ancylobacter tetraedralis]MDQ0510267.1 uncharacterized protein YjeT (DUF2065 family) [Ancylobacter amanitiformis]
MSDLVVALGLLLVIEGLMMAAAPGAVRRALEAIDQLPDAPMRISGLVGAIIGILLIWVIRG